MAYPGTFDCPTDVNMMPALPTVKPVSGTVTNTFWKFDNDAVNNCIVTVILRLNTCGRGQEVLSKEYYFM